MYLFSPLEWLGLLHNSRYDFLFLSAGIEDTPSAVSDNSCVLLLTESLLDLSSDSLQLLSVQLDLFNDSLVSLPNLIGWESDWVLKSWGIYKLVDRSVTLE